MSQNINNPATFNNIPVKAQKEYEHANSFANAANQNAKNALDVHSKYNEQNQRIKNWKYIMATAPVLAFTIIFIIISIGEYLFSKEIYRVALRNTPWAIAFIFFSVGIFISDLISFRLSPPKREWKKFELSRDPNLQNLTNDEINNKVSTYTNQQFIMGIIFAILALVIITYLSITRVQKEIAAGLRLTGFGVMDLIPIILYAAELIAGIYVRYLLKQITLQAYINKLWKQFKILLKKCAYNTRNAVKKYQDAEKEGYNPVDGHVGDNLHEAFYRNKMRDVSDELIYISKCEIKNFPINLIIMQLNNPVCRHINFVTDYKYSYSAASDGTGKIAMQINSFDGDSIRDIFIKENAASNDSIYVMAAYAVSANCSHTILI